VLTYRQASHWQQQPNATRCEEDEANDTHHARWLRCSDPTTPPTRQAEVGGCATVDSRPVDWLSDFPADYDDNECKRERINCLHEIKPEREGPYLLRYIEIRPDGAKGCL